MAEYEAENFRDCFIGIPIPDQFQKQQQDLAQSLSRTATGIKLAVAKRPHLTIAFVKSSTRGDLKLIEDILRLEFEELAGNLIRIGGFGVFSDDDPTLIYVRVSNGENQLEMRRRLAAHPDIESIIRAKKADLHLSMVRVQEEAKPDFPVLRPRLEALMDRAEPWEFLVNEVAIYGKNGHPTADKLYSVKYPTAIPASSVA